MATYNRTSSGGGTVGHPSAALQPYVMTSPVWDTADGGTGGDVIELIDVPADTMVLGGCLEVLEARGNGQVTLEIGVTGADVDNFIDVNVLAAGFCPFLSTAVSGAVANVATEGCREHVVFLHLLILLMHLLQMLDRLVNLPLDSVFML